MTASRALERSTWQVPALALSRWTALLMGWVWLGQQGQRLGWSLASGLTAVALWWAVRLVLQTRNFAAFARWRHLPPCLGVATSVGAAWLAISPPGTFAQRGLLALAVVWACWVHTLERQALASARCQHPWAGWPPLLAAAATWLTLEGSGFVAGLVLLGAVGIAHMAAPRAHATASPRPASFSESIPGIGMGWMMGSLWLSNAWCIGSGWTTHTVIGLHLFLMTVLPAGIRMAWLPRHLPAPANQLLPLLLVAMSAALLWDAPRPVTSAVGMLVLALAWALPQRPSMAQAMPPRHSENAMKWAPLLGPVVLIAVGHWSPLFGPQTLAWAFAALGATACAVALQILWIRRISSGLRSCTTSDSPDTPSRHPPPFEALPELDLPLEPVLALEQPLKPPLLAPSLPAERFTEEAGS